MGTLLTRVLADLGSPADLAIGAGAIAIGIFIAVKVAKMVVKLAMFLLIVVGIYVWVS